MVEILFVVFGKFKKHMEQERVREHLAEHPGLIGIRSEENKQELK